MSDFALRHKRTRLRLVKSGPARVPTFDRDAIALTACDPAMYEACVAYAQRYYPRSLLARLG